MDQINSHSSEAARQNLVRIVQRESKERYCDIVRHCVLACQVLEDHKLLFEVAKGCNEHDMSGEFYKAFAGCVSTFDFDNVRSWCVLTSQARC